MSYMNYVSCVEHILRLGICHILREHLHIDNSFLKIISFFDASESKNFVYNVRV